MRNRKRSPVQGPYQRLRAAIAEQHAQNARDGSGGAARPLEQHVLPDRLRMVLGGLGRGMTLLRAGSLVWPMMPQEPQNRYGRVVAAQLAALALRRHLWFRYDGVFEGPPGVIVSRYPTVIDPVAYEEALLIDLLLGLEESVRISDRTDGQAWDRLSAALDEGIKEEGLAYTRPDRYRTLRLLSRLRRWMTEYAHTGPGWDADRSLHAAGYPYAVLFTLETGPRRWPTPPEEDTWVPSLLPTTCDMAINGIPPNRRFTL